MLRKFVDEWLHARGAAREPGVGRRALEALVTTREPYASRARKDIELLCRGYMPFGFGLAAELDDDVREEPFDGWQRSISPLTFRVSWATDMSGHHREEMPMTIHRVALEPEGFRVVAVFDDVGRERAQEEALLIDRALNRRGEDPA